RLITVEENALMGGFGSAVLEGLSDLGCLPKKVVRLGLPDRFIEHGTQAILREVLGLDVETIAGEALALIRGADGP
ncbi:MAG: transketolase C-terminal domain-containing protein, partial [Dissulfurimicrobium sp.]